MRVVQAVDYHEPRDAISHDWITFLNDLEMTPVLIPNGLKNPCQHLEECMPNLLILTGGDDLDELAVRDKTEQNLSKAASVHNIPVLGVCRCMQLINAIFGGINCAIKGHVNAPHQIYYKHSWVDFFGRQSTVNSFHNTEIRLEDLGTGLRAMAVDEDGFVEGFDHAEE